MGHVTKVAASPFLDITGTAGDSSSFGTSLDTVNQALTPTGLSEVGAPGSDQAIISLGDADMPV